MNSIGDFKKFLLYSVSLHAIVFIFLLLFGSPQTVTPEEPMVVAMVHLSRGTGAAIPKGPSKPQVPVAPVPQHPPAPVPPKPSATEKIPAAPKTEAEKTKPTPPAPHPKEESGPKIMVKKPPEKKPATPPANPPANVPAPQVNTENDQKMAEALNQVKGELSEREKQSQGATGSENPGVPNPGGNGEVGAADPGYAQYQAQVRAKIIREWIRANTGSEGDPLRTRVVVRINASGAVISTGFSKRSGNASFDLSAVRAIERASPLPAPPPSLLTEALNEGFVVDFSSRMLGR